MKFDGFCEGVECPFFKEWEYTLEISDHGRTYQSTIECAACTKNPEAECIDHYPPDCIYLEAIVDYHVTNKRAKALFEKEWEQEKMWDRLERV